jgi:hypothetical protein
MALVNGDKPPKESQATQLVEMVKSAGVELFHTPGGYDSQGYASIEVGGHKEVWPINNTGFRQWLGKSYYDLHGKIANSQATQDALNTISGMAIYEGEEHQVHVRVAEQGGCIWLDLADKEWRVVRIDKHGWRVVSDCPVKFVRKKGVFALPEPVRGGTVDELRPIVNLPDDDSWILFVSWMVAALRPDRPFPILGINGEQGSAKSWVCWKAREVIDPNDAMLRRPPRDEHSLMIAAKNGWVVGFDNLSGIRPDLSDTLCCLATGAGFGTRQYYTDDEERLFSAKRPIVVNGIEDAGTRPDFIDRSIVITLPSIDDTTRKDEDTLKAEFKEVHPRVLGALLDAVVCGLKNIGKVKLDRLPRMADFAKWLTACEPALPWKPGDFTRAYTRNRESANSAALESSTIYSYLANVFPVGDDGNSGTWKGTAGELLTRLNSVARDDAKRGRGWPQTARALAGQLRRYAPNLRRVGIHVVFERATGGVRLIRLTRG